MRILLLALLMSFSAFATTADVDCSINQPIVLDTAWGQTAFRQADVNFWGLTEEGQISSIEVMDRFGPAFEVINRVWPTNQCSNDSLCISTDFSSMRGLTFTFPNEVFVNEYHNFTMRVRLESVNRSVFANCRSSIR